VPDTENRGTLRAKQEGQQTIQEVYYESRKGRNYQRAGGEGV
jgi:hypothetical protein